MPHQIILGRTDEKKKEIGTKGAVKIGKQYITMGKTTNLANEIYLDVSGPHVTLISGKRGSGKSYTMAVIAEGVAEMPEEVKENLACLMIDTMGIYWSMKFPNYRDRDLLEEWEEESKDFSKKVMVFAPKGLYEEIKAKGIPVDMAFSIRPSELEPLDWLSIFELTMNDPVGISLIGALDDLKKSGENFGIDEIIERVERDEKAERDIKNSLVSRFIMAKSWGIFDKKGTELSELLQKGKVSVLDISYYSHATTGFSIRSLIIAILCRKILKERMTARKIEELAEIQKGWRYFKTSYREKKKSQVPLAWIFLDEAHEFLPEKGETIATGPLIQIIREGRQPGISLVLATQQPGKIHSDVMTQCDLVISHRVTSALDVKALNSIMQSYLPYAINKYLNNLPKMKGSAIALDDKQERIFPMQMRPRFTWHGGAEPSAIEE